MSPLAADDGQRSILTSSSSSSPVEVSVSTVAATAVGTGYHLLKVEGYSRLKHTHGKNGSYLESSAFKAAGKTWTIRCYLNGFRKEDAGFVSLFLKLKGGAAAGRVVHTEYEFSLLGHHHQAAAADGTPAAHGARGAAAVTPFQILPFETFFGICDYSGWGRAKFISTEALEASDEFLKDDCFTVRCKVTVVEERAAVKGAVRAKDIEKMGLQFCKCDDEQCKRHHARPPPAQKTLSLRAAFARFLSFMCSP